MASIELHPDFKDFLRLLSSYEIEYLLVGGYAVGYHGYPRATGDMDVWIAVSEVNAEKAIAAIREFGAATITDLPAEQYQPLLAKVQAIPA